MSEQLASTTLMAADKLVDLLAQSVYYESHCSAVVRATKATVINEMLSNKRPTTVVKEIFADDPRYVEASNKYNMALAWKSWLENKHANLLKTHHLCNDLLQKAEAQLGNASWTPNISTDEEVGTTSIKPSAKKSSWNV